MDQQQLIVIGLAAVALIGVVLALFPGFFASDQAKKRQAMIVASGPKRVSGERSVDQATRRKQVADSLKELESKAESKKVSLETKIGQAGLEWTKQRYYLTSLGIGVGLAVVMMVINGSPIVAGMFFFVGCFGVPRWYIGFLRNRRLKKFRLGFPDALDVIIRGVKAGLPLGDCLRIISAEGAEPVRSEFRLIVQSQTIGLAVGEAVDRMAERVPIPEANFFSIVINIQQKSGGNLSETLTNLSRVLRERKKMQGKIKAMSAEAKASAMIIGSLPFAVGFLVYLTSPRYIELLWLTSTGRVVMVGCLFWMSIGIAIIKKMISFDF